MRMPSYKIMLESIALIAETIARNHYNHEQRNARLSVLGTRLLSYMRWIERFSCYVDQDWPEQLIALRALYELTAPADANELGHMNHTAMRNQCWLMVEVAREALIKWEKNEERQKWRDRVSRQMEAEYIADLLADDGPEIDDSPPDGQDFEDFYPIEDDPNYLVGHDLEPGE